MAMDETSRSDITLDTPERMAEERHLPARVPDLILYSGGGAWRLERISPHLEEFLGPDCRDRAVDDLFPEASPSLVGLAEEVAAHGETLRRIRISLKAGTWQTLVVAEVSPLRGEGEKEPRHVQFFFREVTPAEMGEPRIFHGMVGISPPLLEVFRKIKRYGPSDASVVITGETGTGKELVAKALHEESPRADCPFVAVNCSAISRELLESELFGHEKGSFTGALRTHRGRFERADGGTLFLDEIGDMPLGTQVKLLRVLENRTIERVGSERETPIDVRVVCATNVPLEQAVAAGRFRADLYHRLAVLRLHLPPLRERTEDLPFLADFFLAILNRKYHRRIKRLTPEALNFLRSYLWPGNVRELRNILERVVVETEGEVIGARAFREWTLERQHLSPDRWEEVRISPATQSPIIPPYPAMTSDRPLLTSDGGASAPDPEHSSASLVVPMDLDPATIRRAYREAGGNISRAARLLGIHRATLYRHIKKLGLDRTALAR